MFAGDGDIEQGLEDGREVANGNLFAQELLQNFLHFAEAEGLGDKFFDELGVALTEAIKQAFGFLAGEQFVGVLTDHFGEVGGEYGSLVNHRVTGGKGLGLEDTGNPECGDAESRLAGGHSGKRGRGYFGTDSEDLIFEHFPASDFDSAQGDDVFGGREANVGGDMNGRNDKAELQGEAAAQRFDASEELPALLDVDPVDERIADFEGQFVELEEVLDGFGLGSRWLVFLGGWQSAGVGGFDDFAVFVGDGFGQAGREQGNHASDGKEREFRQSGDRGKRDHDAGSNLQGAAAGEQLGAEIDGEGGVRGGAGHDHAAGHRDQKRGDHGDQAVADGKDGVGFERLAKRNVELEDSDEEAGQDVDASDKDGGDGVALIEAGGSVHGPVEFRFARSLFASGGGLMLVDESGIEVGIDRHLLAGESVEGEAGGDFSRAHGAVADDDILDGDEGDEENKSDNVVAAHNELSEGLDDASGGPGAFVAMEKNAAAGGEVEREAKQGKQEQQAGENGKLRRAQDLKGGEQNEHRSGKAGGKQQVERDRRQRHQHDEDQADGRDGDDPFDERVADGSGGGDGRDRH